MVAAALLIGGYLYFRLDDEIRRHVEHRIANHYRDFAVHVGSAQYENDRGITIHDLSILDPQRNNTPQPLLSVDELFLSGNVPMEELLSGQPHVERIIVQGATLRAVRLGNGRWNVGALVPLPKFSDQAPVLVIEDATLILEDSARRGATPFTLRGIDATLTPLASQNDTTPANTPPGQRYQVHGVVAGTPARSVQIEGEIGTKDGSVDLTITANGLEISPDFLETIPAAIPAELSQAQVHGRADILIRLARSPGLQSPLDWSASLQMDRGRFTYPTLPQPVTDLTVKLRATPRQLIVERLIGKLGTADLVLACERQGWSSNAPLGMSVRVVRLPLDERLSTMFSNSAARLWHRFQPTGAVDATARVTFDGQRWNPQLTFECQDVSMTDAERFPYRVEQTKGKLQYDAAAKSGADSLTVDLMGMAEGRSIKIQGKFSGIVSEDTLETNGASSATLEESVAFTTRKPVPTDDNAPAPSSHPVGWLEITGSDVPIHEELLTALPDEGERFVRSLRPQGAVDFRWRAEWSDKSSAKASVTQEIQLKDCSIQYDLFRYPLHHIHGLVSEHNRRWKLHGVQGRGGHDSTVVICHGESTPVTDGRHLDLIFQATDVPLDDNLREALSPEAQQAWSELRPQGRIDFTAHIVHQTGEARPAVDVVARPREHSVSIEPHGFPYRFEQIEGEASFAAGRVGLRNLRARHGSIDYSAALGTWQPTTSGGWQLALSGVNADRLTAHRDLLVALPPRIQKTCERLQPSGTFNLFNSSLSIERRPQSDRITAAWDVYLDCHQASLQGGNPLENITGAIRLSGRDDDQSSYTTGEMAIDSLTCRDLQFTNVRGPIWIDRSVCLFGRRATAKLGQPARP
ncbi:MAG: hypothetical protein L0Z07_04840, partial [Planctomycetes bacterium]|nr:hypothetical protein [Planctomycetota bacterium]